MTPNISQSQQATLEELVVQAHFDIERQIERRQIRGSDGNPELWLAFASTGNKDYEVAAVGIFERYPD